ncbi:hypothetical protein BKA67DRAFT_566638, partial [Truncatella angustata]
MAKDSYGIASRQLVMKFLADSYHSDAYTTTTMSDNRGEIQFVHSSRLGLPRVASAEMHRRVHSHAARTAHAKARRERLVNYQALKASSNSEDGRQPFNKATTKVEIAVISSPISLLESYRRDPFASFARPLNPMEDFLLNYYMQNVVPCSDLQRSKINHPGDHTQHLNRQFVQLAATHASSLDGLFLVTCRHLSQCLPHEELYFIQLALQYKVSCARSLIEAISALGMRSSISDSIVTLAIFLAQDEILIGDITSTKRHLEGAIQMVKHNRALKKTKFSVFLYNLVQKDIANSSLI